MKPEFYAEMIYPSYPSGEEFCAFFDNEELFHKELRFQRKRNFINKGMVLNKQEFLTDIVNALETAGHQILIGGALERDYTEEVMRWKLLHPPTALPSPAMREENEIFSTVHQWEEYSMLPAEERYTILDGHVGQILLNSPMATRLMLQQRYEEIQKKQQGLRNEFCF